MCRPFPVYRGDLVEHFANFVAMNYSYADLVERFFLLLFCVVMVEMFYRFVRSLAFLTLAETTGALSERPSREGSAETLCVGRI